MLEQLAAARAMQDRGLRLGTIGLRQRDLDLACRNSLKGMGIIRRHNHAHRRDMVGETLHELYGCVKSTSWHELLGNKYDHALEIVIEAKVRFTTSPSDWLSHQDSFNDLMLRRFIDFLTSKSLPGSRSTVSRNGALIAYGVLLDSRHSPFYIQHPQIGSRLHALHDRRNKLPGSHPYDLRGGRKNAWLKASERSGLSAKLKVALNQVIRIVESNL